MDHCKVRPHIGYDDGRIGVLLTNLGTPDSAAVKNVRVYLAEFLSDPRVIELSGWIRWLLLHGIILRFRPRRSAKAYRKIWTEQGSPLLVFSRKQAARLQAMLTAKSTIPIRVELAMRYGNPSIQSGLERLRHAGVQRILLLPLYPQYSAATTASTFDALSRVFSGWRNLPELRMISHYHDHPDYIIALVDSIKRHWQQYGKPDCLVFSFHGLPRRYFLAGDPYYYQCQQTVFLVTKQLRLSDSEWRLTFQSRLGPYRWLSPYTDVVLQKLASKGVQYVQVICPGFSADCLETLEEINMQNRKLFIAAGGKEFSYIPALNDSAAHIEALSKLILQHCQGWIKNYNGGKKEHRD